MRHQKIGYEIHGILYPIFFVLQTNYKKIMQVIIDIFLIFPIFSKTILIKSPIS